MKNDITKYLDFDRIDTLLNDFNNLTGMVTGLLDLDGNILSKSGWRNLCTQFHRVNPDTNKQCIVSDTVLANKMKSGEKYHLYKCLNGLLDVSVPIYINGKHWANLFSGQFFLKKPDRQFFRKQALKYGFDEEKYLADLEDIPILSEEQIKPAMNFLHNMTTFISEMTLQKMEHLSLNKALHESEERYRTFVTASSDSIYKMSPDWSEMYALDGRGFIVDTEKANSNWFQEYIPPEDQEMVMSVIQKAIRTKSVFELEHKVWRVDGTIGWTFSRAIPRLDADGEIFEWFGAASDITERVLAKSQLLESEKKFKSVFESANVGKSITLPTGEIDVNQSFCDMLGYTRQELQNKKWQDLTPEDEIPSIQNELAPLLKGRKDSVRFEKNYICKNGKLILADVSSSIRRDDSGTPLYFITTIVDISERKQAEESLKKSEKELKKAQATAHIGNWQLDYATNKIVWSEELYKMYGFDPKLPPPTLNESNTLFTPESWELLSSSIAKTGETGIPYEIELNLKRKDGSKGWMWAHGEPIFNKENEIVGLWGAAQDITERKLVEEKVAESEMRYRTLFENMTAGFVLFETVFDDKGIPVDLIIAIANERFEATTGLKLREAIGERLTQVLPGIEKDAANWIGTYSKVAMTGIPTYFEQGSELLGVYYAVTAYAAGPNQCAVIFEDITERKRVDIALKKSEEKFRTAFENSAIGMSLTGLDGRLIAVNRPLCNMLKYTKDELEGTLFSDITHPDDIEIGIESLKNMLSGKNPTVSFEKRFFDKTGKPVWVYINSSIIKNENGDPEHFITQIENISDRVKAEKLREESEKRLQLIFDTVGDIIYLLKVEGENKFRFESVNKSFTTVTGLKEEMILGKLVNDIIPEPSLSMVLKKCSKAIKENVVVKWEETSDYPNGRLTGSVSIAPVLNNEGICVKIVATIHDFTEQRDAEKKLIESENQLKTMIDQAPLGIGLVDSTSGRFIKVNDKYASITGLSLEELEKTDWLKITHPDDIQPDLNYMSQLIKGKLNKYNLEKRYIKPDGSVVWVNLTAAKINIGKKGNQQHMAMVEDITKKKLAEIELAESASKFKALVDQSLTGIYIFSKDRFNYVNDRFCEIFGYPKEEVLSKLKPTDVVSEKERSTANENIHKRLTGQVDSVHYTAQGKRKDGKLLWIEIFGTHINIKGEDVITGTVLDITDRKVNSEKLIQSETKFRRLYETMGMGTVVYKVITDKKGKPIDCRYLDINEKYTELSGYTKKMVLRKTLLEINPDIESYWIEELGKVALTGEPTYFEEYYAEHDKYYSFYGYQPEKMQCACLVRDITERKRNEIELEKHRLKLEELVEERTKKLNEANKELESFTYSVSHDLRAPLRAIDGYTEILLSDYVSKFDDEGKRLGGVLQHNAKKMGQLIDDLLAFSRLGNSSIRLSTVDMKEMAVSTFIELTSEKDRARINFTVDSLPKVKADHNLMKQVWVNLISNAIKFSGKKQIAEISISTNLKNNMYIFSVKDNGAGFNMKYKEKLFGVFQRLHLEKEYEGTGVGLAIIHRIIKKHGGEVWANGKVDNGAEFYFSLKK